MESYLGIILNAKKKKKDEIEKSISWLFLMILIKPSQIGWTITQSEKEKTNYRLNGQVIIWQYQWVYGYMSADILAYYMSGFLWSERLIL